eukprot:6078062-Pyramimonas_sp.AAC.1
MLRGSAESGERFSLVCGAGLPSIGGEELPRLLRSLLPLCSVLVGSLGVRGRGSVIWELGMRLTNPCSGG